MFVVYSKDGCPYCDKVAGLLQWLELKHVIYKLDRDFTKESFIAEYGDRGSFPQVTFNDNPIGGCSETIQFVRDQKHLPPKPEE